MAVRPYKIRHLLVDNKEVFDWYLFEPDDSSLEYGSIADTRLSSISFNDGRTESYHPSRVMLITE